MLLNAVKRSKNKIPDGLFDFLQYRAIQDGSHFTISVEGDNNFAKESMFNERKHRLCLYTLELPTPGWKTPGDFGVE